MYSIVYFTGKDREEVHRIGKNLVEERLIAGANIFPIESIYHWKGKIEESKEFAAICKTREENVRAVTEAIKKLHSYEVPCVVKVRIDAGHKPFLDWITESTKRDSSE